MSHRKRFWTWTTIVSIVGGLSIFYVATGQALEVARKLIAVLDTPAKVDKLQTDVSRIMLYMNIPTNGVVVPLMAQQKEHK